MKETNVKKRHIIDDMDKPLFIATIILIIIGTLSIVSASANESISRYGNSSVYYYFYRHIFLLGIGFVGAFVIHRIPTKLYKIIAPLLWATILVILIVLFIYGTAHRGSLNWILIFGIKFQPSEFAKPIIIVMLALLFDWLSRSLKKGTIKNEWSFVAIWFVFGIIIPAIVFFQGDIGTGGIIAVISFGMFAVCPLEKKSIIKYLLTIFGIGILCFVILFMARGYIFSGEQKERLTQFLNPCSNYDDSGYQICNCFIAMNDGGIKGLGIGKSKQKYSYIPEAYTDSIFAIIIEEVGVVMGILIILLYLFMICRILKISQIASTTRGRYIAFGTAIYLFMHVLLNLGGLLGILPLTGVPLPLITYGGSFTIAFIASLALTQRVCIESKHKKISIKNI